MTLVQTKLNQALTATMCLLVYLSATKQGSEKYHVQDILFSTLFSKYQQAVQRCCGSGCAMVVSLAWPPWQTLLMPSSSTAQRLLFCWQHCKHAPQVPTHQNCPAHWSSLLSQQQYAGLLRLHNQAGPEPQDSHVLLPARPDFTCSLSTLVVCTSKSLGADIGHSWMKGMQCNLVVQTSKCHAISPDKVAPAAAA